MPYAHMWRVRCWMLRMLSILLLLLLLLRWVRTVMLLLR